MSNTSLFRKRISDSKFLVVLVAALALVVDVSLMIIALLGELSAVHWLLPMIIAVLDLVIIPVTLASNFRFRYAQLSVLAVKAVAVIVMAVIVLINFTPDYTVFTVAALIAFAAVQGMSVISLIFTGASAAKPKKSPKLLAIICTVLLLACAVLYPVFMWTNGIYGQGDISNRNVAYRFDAATQSYVVCDVLDGKGDSVVIPDAFNGKPVKYIDCMIFEDTTLKNVYLECDSTVEFLNPTVLNEDVNIFIDRDSVDSLKQTLAKKSKDDIAYLNISNRLCPSGLEEDEVYVTFTYTSDSIQAANYELIKTWFGKAGDTFSLATHASGITYANGFDRNSEDFLYRSYQNNKKVLMPVTVNGKDIDGTKITEAIENVAVDFENVYAIAISEDNDDKYESDDSFREYNNSGYRYVLSTDNKNLLSQIDARPGFTLDWNYSTEGESKKPLTSLKSVLGSKTEITVYPEWKLNAPEITSISTNNAGNSFIYGNDVTLTGVAIAPVVQYSLNYAWANTQGQVISTASIHEMENVIPAQDGVYTLTVTAYSDTETSLTSTATKTIDITINKRPVSFEWNFPANTVYSASDKLISATADNTDFINGDVVTGTPNHTSVRNAGSYSLVLNIDGEMADLYCVAEEDRFNSITITPYEATAVWTETSLVYNRTMQKPVATVYGVGAEASSKIEVAIGGMQQNVGNYTATASSLNANYTIGNPTQDYEITRKLITLTWPSSTEHIYDAKAWAPTVSISGVISGDSLNPVYSDYSNNITVDSYTVTVTGTTNANYMLPANVECDYTIVKRELTATWPTATDLTYNAQNQQVKATIGNVAQGDTGVNFTYSATSANKNVGGYVATITGVNNENYSLPANLSCDYNIVQRAVTLTWPNTKTFTYDGAAHTITATLGNVMSGDTVTATYTAASTNTNAGTYNATVASLSNSNYKLPTHVSAEYIINPKGVTLTWQSNTTFTYDGTIKSISATVGGLVGSDTVTLTYSNSAETAAVGTYKMQVTGLGNANYKLPTSTEKSYTVQQRELTLTWPTATVFTYDGTAHTVSATPGNIVGSDTIKLGYTTASSNTAAGTYVSTANATGNNNYKLPANYTCPYTIEKREVTVSWGSERTYTYNGQAQSVKATFGNVVGTDTVNAVYSTTSSNKAVGDYTAKITGLSNNNYKLPTAGLECGYTITERLLTVTWSSTVTFTYNGDVQHPTVSFGNTVSGDTITPTYTGTATDVGNYSVSLTGISNANYVLPATGLYREYSIIAKELTLTWQSGTTFTYDGAAHTVTATARDVFGDILTLTYSDTSENIDAGSYLVYVESVSDSNYKLPAVNYKQYTINPRTVTLTWDSVKSFVYDGNSHAVYATIGNIVTGDTVNATYADTSANVGVGSYTAKVTALDNSNYKLPTSVTCNYTVTAKPITLTWNSLTSFEYDGSVHTVKANANGLVGADTVSLVYSSQGNKNVGNYTVTVTATGNNNYKLPSTGLSCNYTITQRELTVNWSSTTTFTYNGTSQYPTATFGNIVVGDSVTPTYSGMGKNVGTHTVTISSISNANYKLPANKSCSYEITPKGVTIDLYAMNTTLTYNGEYQTPKVAFNGVLTGDTVSATFTSASAKKDVGIYSATVQSLTNSNYVLEGTASFSYNIAPKKVTVSWNYTGPYTEDGEIHAPTANIEGLIGDDSVDLLYTYYLADDRVSDPKEAGSYTVVVTLNASNYVIDGSDSFEFEIVEAEISK